MNDTSQMNIVRKGNRIPFIDVARGIAILLMIIGHVVSRGHVRDFIFSFHMPLFFITGGMCFRQKSVKSALLTDLRKIIVPYALVLFVLDLWSGSLNLVYYLRQMFWAASWQNLNMYPADLGMVWALWFFPAFFLTRWIFRSLYRVSGGRLFRLAVLSLAVCLVGIAWGMQGRHWLPLNLDVAMASVGFYCFGFFLQQSGWTDRLKPWTDRRQTDTTVTDRRQADTTMTDRRQADDIKIRQTGSKRRDSLSNLRTSGHIAMLAEGVIWISGIYYCPIELASRLYPMGIFSFITAICGCMVVFRFSAWIGVHTRFLRRTLSWYGRYSNQILCFHALDCIPRAYLDAFLSFPKNPEAEHLVISIWRILLSTAGTGIYLWIHSLAARIKAAVSGRHRA